MNQEPPKNWSNRRIYSSESVGAEVNIAFLRPILSSTDPEDRDIITSCIEEKRIHPDLEIRKITSRLIYKGPQPHPLASLRTLSGERHRGLFANKKISNNTAIGEFVGEVRLLNYDSAKGKSDTYNLIVIWKNQYLVCIDSRKIANEMMCINDYRGLQKEPNIQLKWVINRGFYYCCYVTSRDIEPDEEIVSYYGPDSPPF